MLDNSLASRGTAATSVSGTARSRRLRSSRSAITNNPRKQVLRGDTREGRRLLDLAHAFAEALGGWPALTDLQAARVRRVAELQVLAEQARAAALLGKHHDAMALVRLENVAARALRSLNLPSDHDERDAERSNGGDLDAVLRRPTPKPATRHARQREARA